MGVSSALIKFDDGHVLHGNYCNTTDILVTPLYASRAVADEHGDDRNQQSKPCSCSREEHASASIDYGHGVQFETTACRHCLKVVGQRTQYPDPPQPSLWEIWREEDESR